MKIKLQYMEDYKKYFTLAQLKTAREILNDTELNENLESYINIATGNCEEVLKVTAEICLQQNSIAFDNEVDIFFKITSKKDSMTFEEITITLGEIYQIGDGNNHGYRRTYKLV